MAIKYYILQIDSKWRITLPKELRKYMGLRKGSHLLVYPLNNVLLMIKVNKNFHEATKRLRKAKKRFKKLGKEDVFKVLKRIRSAKYKPSIGLKNKVVEEVRAKKKGKRK
ncbi:AbrB/MazE/SpoVT family DNA-binding domain-containing protein [Candidatus Woesearchaeota archaeon]|nr:AbrB/MazE/SpoVT family DNA-binding domain-containing protein [Candidatus Woesearchaeota archaeon]